MGLSPRELALRLQNSQRPIGQVIPTVDLAIIDAARGAWERYDRACQSVSTTPDERWSAYRRASLAEHAIWVALGVDAGKAT